MDKKITFDEMPAVMAEVLNELKGLKSQIAEFKFQPEAKPKRSPILIDEAAKLINKSKFTVYALCQNRKIPHYKSGKQLYFFEDELLDFIQNGRRKTSAEILETAEMYSRKR